MHFVDGKKYIFQGLFLKAFILNSLIVSNKAAHCIILKVNQHKAKL